MKKFVRATLLLSLSIAFALSASAQFASQQILREGLLTQNHRGSFIASSFAPDGSLYILLDAGDGVRVLKTDSNGSTLEAQLHFGAAGDSAVALAVDPSGNLYIAGTSASGSLAGTSGVPFPAPADSSTNSFVAKLDPQLNLVFLTFAGAGHTAATSIAATANAVLVTGTIFNSTLPVTANAVEQTAAAGSNTNGFVESFSADGATLNYATYVTGLNGDTEPTAIAADSAGHAFIAGETSSSGYPTINALQPDILGSTSGFLTELTPAGDGLVFSTFVAGSGVTGLALNSASNSLLLTGTIALGQFPVATANAPLASSSYQSLVTLSADGQSVLNSVVLGPGTQSHVASAPDGTAWVTLSLSTPLLPSTIAASFEPGDTLLLHVLTSGAFAQSLRVGGSPIGNASYASLTTSLAAPAVSADGSRIAAAGTVAINLSSSLLATQQFDLPVVAAPDALLPNSVQDIVPDAATCGSASQCAGSGGLLVIIDPTIAAPSLAVSAGDVSNITLNNLGSAAASSLSIAASGYSLSSDCGSSLSPASQCSIALNGSGPGSLTISADGMAATTLPLPASTSSPDPLALSASELDFGIVSGASAAATRTLTVTNLTAAPETFAAAIDAGPSINAYTLALSATTCIQAAQNELTVAANNSCTLTFSLAASTSSSDDGPVRSIWKIGTRDVTITGFAQAAAINLSASEIDFGPQSPLPGAKHLPRYLFVSNNSQSAVAHTTASLPASSPFSIIDDCPSTLQPQSVCRLTIAYSSATAPSIDSATLNMDDGLTVLLTGQTLSEQSVSGSTTDPSVAVSPTSLSFADPVTVTELSTSTQGVQVTNSGPTPVALSASITGDFTLESQCPASLASGSSCELLVSFAPSQPGVREGLLSVSAGGAFSPTTIALGGTATAILPPNNGTLALGTTNVGEPIIAWYQIQGALPSLTVSSNSPTFAVALAASSAQPPSLPSSAFSSSVTGSCIDCWLGIQFLSQTAGTQTASLALSTVSGGNPEALTLTASATPLSGLQLTPSASDFGSVPLHSSTAPVTLTLTNLLTPAITANIQSITASGDFTVLPAASGDCSLSLQPTAACTIRVAFAPTALGARTGTLTVVTDAGTATASLSGYGTADPGIAFEPDALVFNNQSGAAATQQTITVANTSTAAITIGAPTTSSVSFAAASSCGSLAPSAQCSITVTFTPGDTFPQATLTVPVSTGAGAQLMTTSYGIGLSATYASSSAGLLITPSQSNLGTAATGSVGSSRQFRVTNLTAQSLALSISLPRQFPLTGGSNCTSLAAGATCTLSVSLAAATNGPLTGTLQVTGTPSAGASIQSLAYLLGFGEGSGSLTITGASSPINLGSVASGQSTKQSITLTNSGTGPLNIRRIVSQPPFFAVNSCGATLAPNANCAVTITYAPVYELAAGSTASPTRLDTGLLTIESDAVSSADALSLEGTASAVTSAQPSSGASGSYTLSSSALTFASTQVGNASSAQTITLTNSGTAALHIGSVLAPADFTATSSCTTLLPSAACTLSVQFTPGDQSAQQLRTGTLEISSDAANALEFVTLLGGSTPAPLSLTPGALDFGSVSIGQSDELSVNVANTSSSPITLGSLGATGAFSVTNGTCPASGAQLAAGAQCALSVTFTPTSADAQTGTLSVASSATQFPLTVSLTGTGTGTGSAGGGTTPSSSFTLTVSGSSAASVTLASGQPATFALTATSTNGYSGPVALTCDPLGSAPYASCSLLASALTLANNAQSSTATINTITSAPQSSERLAGILLLPVLLAVAGLSRTRRRLLSSALVVALATGALSLSGCGSGPAQTTPSNLLYTPAGTYQWRVTASSTSGPAISSSVVLTVTIQ
jgi:hypothetical protein